MMWTNQPIEQACCPPDTILLAEQGWCRKVLNSVERSAATKYGAPSPWPCWDDSFGRRRSWAGKAVQADPPKGRDAAALQPRPEIWSGGRPWATWSVNSGAGHRSAACARTAQAARDSWAPEATTAAWLRALRRIAPIGDHKQLGRRPSRLRRIDRGGHLQRSPSTPWVGTAPAKAWSPWNITTPRGLDRCHASAHAPGVRTPGMASHLTASNMHTVASGSVGGSGPELSSAPREGLEDLWHVSPTTWQDGMDTPRLLALRSGGGEVSVSGRVLVGGDAQREGHGDPVRTVRVPTRF